MASTKLMTTKDGKRFYRIFISRGRGKACYTMRWYCPDGWSQKAIERELIKVAAAFELKCNSGEVLNRAQAKEVEAQEAEKNAMLKTFRAYADGVFMNKKRPKLSHNGVASYESYLNNHIYPVIGDYLLRDISPAMLDRLIDNFQVNHSHASTIKLYNILNGIFKQATKDDSVLINPMSKLDRPTPKRDEVPQADADKAYTADELRHILRCVRNESLHWQAFIYLMADTGMRRGECCGVQWADICFDTNTITIRHNLQYTPTQGVYDKRPKNSRVRVVDIGEDTAKLLKQLMGEQSRAVKSDWTFSQDGTDSPMHPQTPTRFFKNFGVKYGVVNFHPHKLRHTSVSLSLLAGADLSSVSQRAGHSNTGVTAKIYAHSNQDGVRRAGQLARDMLKLQETATE